MTRGRDKGLDNGLDKGHAPSQRRLGGRYLPPLSCLLRSVYLLWGVGNFEWSPCSHLHSSLLQRDFCSFSLLRARFGVFIICRERKAAWLMLVDMGTAYLACGHLSGRGTFPALTYDCVQSQPSNIDNGSSVSAVGFHSKKHCRIHEIGF